MQIGRGSSCKVSARPRPDMVITDLRLPGLEGVALIERLANDEQTSDLPIMVLSNDADLDQVQKVYRLGAIDFLVVPFHPEALQEKVARHLSKAAQRKPTGKPLPA
ncbi:MAG: response regulator [Leptolyngbya sp. RL_3_1]|nr:response regulator [Leptolyngbya sp. RL_3_1]